MENHRKSSISITTEIITTSKLSQENRYEIKRKKYKIKKEGRGAENNYEKKMKEQ